MGMSNTSTGCQVLHLEEVAATGHDVVGLLDCTCIHAVWVYAHWLLRPWLPFQACCASLLLLRLSCRWMLVQARWRTWQAGNMFGHYPCRCRTVISWHAHRHTGFTNLVEACAAGACHLLRLRWRQVAAWAPWHPTPPLH